jgi:opacity protein-like surface antigen
LANAERLISDAELLLVDGRRRSASTSTNGGSTTRWGWTVGGGIEWAFTNNWSLDGEYRHTDFGSRGTTVNIPDGLGGTFATGRDQRTADHRSGDSAPQLPLR